MGRPQRRCWEGWDTPLSRGAFPTPSTAGAALVQVGELSPGAALRHSRAAPGRELRFFWVSVGARWGQRQIQMSRGDQLEAAAPTSHSGWARQTDPHVCPGWA